MAASSSGPKGESTSRRRRRAGPRPRPARRGVPAMPSCQLLSQSLDSLVQAAAGRLRRAAERGGDLGVGEVAAVAQRHRRSLLRRQGADRRPDPVVSGSGSSTGDLGRLGDRQRPAPVGAVMVDRLAVGDRQQPAAQVVGVVELRVGAQGGEEGLLEAVLGVGRGRRRRAARPSRRRRARRAGSGTGASRSLMD